MAIKRQATLLANVVYGADVGMVEGRGRLGLTLEAAQRLGIARHFIGQEL